MKLTKACGGAVLAAMLAITLSSRPANAFMISVGTCTGSGSGSGSSGNPSGQLCTTVSDLTEGDMFPVFWTLPANTQNDEGKSLPVTLTGNAEITVDAIVNGEITLTIAIANTTDPGSYTGRLSLTSFGITTGSNTVTGGSVETTGSKFQFGVDNFPAFSTDGCFFSGNNCAGGGQPENSLNPGDSETFVATLTGDFADGQGLTLDTFASKWQTGNGSYKLAGVVPIPAAAWLFATALGGLGAAGWRKRRRA